MLKSKITARFAVIMIAFVAVIMVFSAVNVPTITVYAENSLEDDLSTQQTTDGEDDLFGAISDEELDPDDQGVADWLKGQEGLTGDQLQSASSTLSPITNLIGYITGGIIILAVAGVTAITALDILYIAVPPVRNVLYKAGTDGTGGYTGGFGAGGYGRGMGGMAAMGAGGAAGGTKKPTQWVSDEAVACAALLGGSAQTGNNMMGGMGFGMQQQQQQTPTTRSVIGVYFRKRIVFLLLLALCVIVLTSSAIMDCGVNLAEWFLKIVGMLNGKMS